MRMQIISHAAHNLVTYYERRTIDSDDEIEKRWEGICLEEIIVQRDL